MRKNLLLVSYFFPPGNIIGAVRPYQIARHFSRQGWNVHVICCRDKNVPDDYSVDMSGLVVHRLSASRMLGWLNSVTGKNKGILSRIHHFLLKGIRFFARSFFFPEPFVLVKKAFVTEIENLTKVIDFDLLISSSKPFTMHTIAHSVSQRYSIPWVADNRDLWAHSPYRRNIIPRQKIDIRYERKILEKSQLVLGVSQGMIDFYKKSYGLHRTLLIMNGYENGLVHQQVETEGVFPKQLNIVYGGVLYGYLRDPSVLFKAVSDNRDLSASVRLHFYGAERDVISSLASQFTGCAIEQHNRVSKTEIAEKYQAASVLLVILGNSDFENGVMTGKFFEYLSFGKPVLAIASDKTELAKIINESGVGLASNDPARIASFLRDLLSGAFPLPVNPPKELSIDHQLSRLMDSVDSILKEGAQ
jgi:glycosyltransferase involved in cell wall biosynthesis